MNMESFFLGFLVFPLALLVYGLTSHFDRLALEKHKKMEIAQESVQESIPPPKDIDTAKQ